MRVSMPSLVRVVFLIFLLCAAQFADAQAEKKLRRIGVLARMSSLSELEARSGPPQGPARLLEEGLKKLGWVDGQNIQFVWKSAEGEPDRLDGLAEELVRERVDVIVAMGGVSNAFKKTKTIPIVMAGSVFLPVEAGYAVSLARPGKNVTGLSLGSEPRISNKVIALLKEAIPGASRIAMIWGDRAPAPKDIKDMSDAAKEDQADMDALGVTLLPMTYWGPSALPGAFEEAVRQGAKAMLILITPGVGRKEEQDMIRELAIRHRMPVAHNYLPQREWGGILAYGNDPTVRWKRLPYYVDRILRGANPGDIPIEEPTRYELHVNLKSAKAIGVTIPGSLLIRADRVIE